MSDRCWTYSDSPTPPAWGQTGTPNRAARSRTASTSLTPPSRGAMDVVLQAAAHLHLQVSPAVRHRLAAAAADLVIGVAEPADRRGVGGQPGRQRRPRARSGRRPARSASPPPRAGV